MVGSLQGQENRPNHKGDPVKLAVNEPSTAIVWRGAPACRTDDGSLGPGVGRDLDQVALLDLPGAAQPSVARAADVEDKGEATLNLFGAHLESLAGNCSLQPRPIVVDGPASRVVAVPTGKRSSCSSEPLCPKLLVRAWRPDHRTDPAFAAQPRPSACAAAHRSCEAACAGPPQSRRDPQRGFRSR